MQGFAGTLLKTTQDCIFWKDTERRFLGANKAFLDYFGFPSEDVIIGKTVEELGFHEDPEPYRSDEYRVLAGESMKLVPGTCFCRGEERDIMVSKYPIYEEGKITGVVGSFIDVTEGIRHERKIEELNKKLEKALKNEKHVRSLMNEFMSRMRLEIRKPINAISSLSYIDRDIDDAERLRGDMAKIYASSHYVAKLANDLLDMRAMEGEKLTFDEQRIALAEIADGIETVGSDIARTKDLEFTVERDFPADICLLCDPGRVQQVALNLIMNAINFTDRGGTVTVQIHAEVKQRQKVHLTITVTDTGCGIGARYLSRIFEPFFREKRNPNKYGTGTGLGLTIAKHLVEAMRGEITVESEEDLGSVFTATMVFGQ